MASNIRFKKNGQTTSKEDGSQICDPQECGNKDFMGRVLGESKRTTFSNVQQIKLCDPIHPQLCEIPGLRDDQKSKPGPTFTSFTCGERSSQNVKRSTSRCSSLCSDFCFLDPFAQICSNHKTIAIKFQDAARHCTQTRGCQRKTRAAMPQGFFLKFPAKRRDVKIGRIEQHYQIIPWETLPGGDLPKKNIHLHPLCNHQESCRICQSVNCGNRGAQGLIGCVVVIAGSSKVKPAGNAWLG